MNTPIKPNGGGKVTARFQPEFAKQFARRRCRPEFTQNYASMSKLLVIDIESAFARAVSGESVRKIANSLRVTEGALRYHFRKGASPKEVRRLAFELFYANRRLSMLNESEQRLVDRLVQKGRSKSNVAT